MATPVARLGDGASHPGKITSVASKHTVEGARVACVGDTFSCAIHGDNPITTGCPVWTVGGKKVARSGSMTTCGAVIVGGATHTNCE